MRLVRLMDRLITLLEKDPEFRCFNFDGQTVVIEDYLEVKPEMRPRLEKLIRAGRIVIGPWYMLPDEWLVTGEATIRNMLRGRAICREFGVKPPNVGYLPDMFGHISQTPQLLLGFGYDSAIMWRGLSGDQWMSELWWESPDGSRVFAFHLPEYVGYANAAFFYHSLPPEARTLDPSTPGYVTVQHDLEFASSALRAVADRAIAKSRSGCLLFMNGVDHMEAQPQIPGIIRLANRKLGDVEISHSTFEEFLAAAKKHSPEDLQVIRGEQRSTTTTKDSWTCVLPNILSSRIYLKLANARCQQLLEKWTEPFSSAAAWIGDEYREGLIHTGWKWLLQNHPHDSIGGCSVDAVHRQMETRFEWAEEIADIVANSAIHRITGAVNTSSLADNEVGFCLFNPLNWTVSDLVEVDIDLDEESGWLSRNGIVINRENVYENLRNLRITAWDGKPVTFELLDVRYAVHHRPWREVFGPTYQVIRCRVALWAEDLPALGYRTYRVGLASKPRRLPNRHGTGNPARMQNEHLTVDVNPNGTLRVTGAALDGAILDNLHYLEDGGDNGDGYTYSPPRHDAVVTSLAGRAQITRLHDEPAIQAIAVDYTLEVPESVSRDRQHRAPQTIPFKVRSVFRLGARSRRIDVETTITNDVRDHRLRVCFPVPAAGATHHAESQFDIVERANRIVQPAEEHWIEDMPLEQPHQAFVTYSNLALANLGIHEYELVEGDPSFLKLTLLRAVNYLGAGPHVNTILGGAGPMFETPDQQMIGRTLTLRYSIIPHAGDRTAAGVQREAHQHNALWRGMVTLNHEGSLPPDNFGFLSVSGRDILMSAVKKVDGVKNAFMVRFWNSGCTDSRATVRWFRRPASVNLSNLAEARLEPLDVSGTGTTRVKVKPKQIVTIRFQMDSTGGRK
jgi:alpha-mannosidase